MKSTRLVALAVSAGIAVSMVTVCPANADTDDQALITSARAGLTTENQTIFDTLTPSQQLEYAHFDADAANSPMLFADDLQANYPDYQVQDDTETDSEPVMFDASDTTGLSTSDTSPSLIISPLQPRYYEVHTWWTKKASFFGMTLTSSRLDYYYRVTPPNGVTSDHSCTDKITNYVPTRTFSYSIQHWTSSHRGYCYSTITKTVRGVNQQTTGVQKLVVGGSGIISKTGP